RSVIVSTNGEPIATLTGEENRRIVPLAQIAPIARNAVLAIEDARFYEHNGIDGSSLLRALFANAKAGRVREGGSTITQQLVKNVLVGSERTIDRKLREAQYAIALEKQLKSKSRILELYLNETYFGDGVYGIETAAEYYFGTPAAKLTTVQAALLAGLIAAPERYNPLTRPRTALARRSTVLRRMAGERFITREEADRLDKAPLGVSKHPLPKPVEPYFVDFIKKQILEDSRLGTPAERERALFQGGLRIETTLDLRLQKAAREAVDSVLNLPKDPAGALVSVEPTTGMVRAMVGGKDFNTEQYNLAIGNNRQAGSVMKPFVMTAALNEGVSPGLTLDTPSPLFTTDELGRPWRPRNYSGRGEGLMSMRRATELSVNTYFVQLIKLIGPQKAVDMAVKLGITSKLEPYSSLALGTFGVSPYEMSSAYGTLANGGVACRPFTIRRVVAANGKELARNDPSCKRVIDSTVVAQATNLLEGVILRGTGRRNGQIGRPVAGKTGTTDDYTDAWFIGYTRQFATAVWLGFPESTKRGLHNIHGLPDVFGGSLPAQIWNKYMKVAHKDLPVLAFPAPPAAERVPVPDVLGRPRDEALPIIKAAGFTVRTAIVAGTQAPGIVISQNPGPGTIAEKGTLIEIQVSDGTGSTYPSPTPTATPYGAEPTPG
ncbi:MAG: penicillin-binding protein, partial [Actinomycetota bacterium]